MRVIYSKSATKALRRMPERDAQNLMAKLDVYAETGLGDVIALVGMPLFRLRHGDWRAIFEVEGDVIVVRVAHRREVYD